jgi:hypothetical protein
MYSSSTPASSTPGRLLGGAVTEEALDSSASVIERPGRARPSRPAAVLLAARGGGLGLPRDHRRGETVGLRAVRARPDRWERRAHGPLAARAALRVEIDPHQVEAGRLRRALAYEPTSPPTIPPGLTVTGWPARRRTRARRRR